ncbi:histone deacetylase [Salinactinospora qingdaonensis]|uniref:Histone deacetylase n=1 Tax=Salinactinospora qingdaonensis TaxID=702744 RepID=A0ABP7GCJ0_9ACTN
MSYPAEPDFVWYASYGANMCAERLHCYVAGGTPPGGSRANPGCRNTTLPCQSRAVWLRGGVYFALASPMWSGGLAMYDPALPGATPARAYLVTAEQFHDIAAQEMYRSQRAAAGAVGAVVAAGRQQWGQGRYETVLYAGELEGRPILTFTASWGWDEVEPVAPSAAYLSVIGTGLRQGHVWAPARTAAYLAGRPGAAGVWSPAAVARLVG